MAPTILNRPTPQALAGRWRSALEWRVLAADAGVPTASLGVTSDGGGAAPGALAETGTWALAVDGRVLRPGAPVALHRAATRLSRRVDARVLGLRFEGADPASAGWRLVDATPHPDLCWRGRPASPRSSGRCRHDPGLRHPL